MRSVSESSVLSELGGCMALRDSKVDRFVYHNKKAASIQGLY